MATFARAPRPPLSTFVSVIWVVEDYVAGPHQSERFLPSGECSLLVHLRDTYTEPIVSGPHTESFDLETAAQVAVAGAVFRPGGIFPFVAVPVGDLANSHVALEDLWGPLAGELRERVVAAPTLEGKVDVLERVLLDRLATGRAGRPEVAYARAALERGATIAFVTGRTGLSHRRFLDMFAAEVGLTPKVYARLRRFRRALDRIAPGRDVDWTEIALTCGYFDQAHFVHDFRAFAGMTPGAYERFRVSQNHVAILD